MLLAETAHLPARSYGYNDVGYHESKPSSANPSGEPTTSPLAGAPMTPYLDELAYQSMRLEMYYVQPLCSPTRATIMTGRFTSHTGVGPNVIKPSAPYAVPKNETFLPELLKQAGYAVRLPPPFSAVHFSPILWWCLRRRTLWGSG